MPNKTIYVRTDDLELFKEKYTPTWLHEKLGEGLFMKTVDKKQGIRNPKDICKLHKIPKEFCKGMKH